MCGRNDDEDITKAVWLRTFCELENGVNLLQAGQKKRKKDEVKGNVGMMRLNAGTTREITGNYGKSRQRKKTNVHYFKLRRLKRVRIIVN